ncbi:WXG100-like domain-containing protein [Nocardia bovistercoris]|uniref:Outer membrane channel protein CpnT-like N-terminal domain-containing protein n=1 Tax=Nocardia bovistercoris TaxID=2785916 RepID=A0A931I8M8_9NOCA|nr:hypothetical protein [Nocardia bovistercoris]MBH0776131.1 hypothetical protein [Nocardia bovistercoris]
MTVAVDPTSYYKAATLCFDSADALWDSFRYVFSELSGCGAMAGIDEDGRKWAASYNQSAAEAVTFFESTYTALYSYGVALNDLGFTHARSDATLKGTAQPERPKDPAGKAFGPYAVPAAAGGAGIGLAETAVEVLDAINCPLPDGNTDKLAKAAEAWDRLGTIYQNTNAKDKITIAGTLFTDVLSDDVIQVREDLKTLENSIGELLTSCVTISKSSTDYRDSIQELRNQIKGFIEAIITEAAINVAITVVASCLTGVGGVIAGAKAVESARRWAVKIQEAVKGWRIRKALQLKGVDENSLAAIAKSRKTTQDLRDRLGTPTGGRQPKIVPSNTRALTDEDRWALLQGPSDRSGRSLTEMLRRGETLTPDQQRQVDAFNEALSKLPAHEGPVTRHTNLTQQQLDQYVPGQAHSEVGFTSTSTRPQGSNELLVNGSNVEFQIASKTGRDYTAYGTPDEILFPSGTNFFVNSKTIDPATGKVVIRMSEM